MSEDPNQNNNELKNNDEINSLHKSDESMQSGGVLSGCFLTIWYLFLGMAGIALLVFVALFVVCMV